MASVHWADSQGRLGEPSLPYYKRRAKPRRRKHCIPPFIFPLLRTDDYDFPLPERLIARYPPAGRSDARMMVLHRAESRLEHRAFTDFPGYLRPGDLAVLNDARVIPARIFANDGALELLVVERPEPTLWVCLVKPGRKARLGASVRLGEVRGIVERLLDDGERVIRLDGHVDLEKEGALPLPPYLHRAAEPSDAERYQTVFARAPGAIAAPTAGLHFTPEILRAIPHAFLTLHVGIGTFKPVKSDDLSEHRMHSERFEISPEAAEEINWAVGEGGRIFAVGTTVVRVLEACARDASGRVLPQSGQTDIFIHPPQTLLRIDALLTNFHLPRSTLLMLVSALAGREFALEAYREAVREEYRFFSYGDCMLIL
jgi:S-adenosylmethionine:tRNA ribosyltransferase-isomerase